MGVEAKVYAALSGFSSLTNLVGDKIYPEHRHQSTGTPAVVYYRAPGGERVTSLKGYSQLENAIIEISVYTSAVDDRRAIADQVISAMSKATAFGSVLPDPPYDDYDDETQTYERTLMFSVWNQTT